MFDFTELRIDGKMKKIAKVLPKLFASLLIGVIDVNHTMI